MAATTSKSDVLLVERRGHVLLMTLNRPEVRNAFNLELSQTLADALESLDADPNLRVGVLTGAGKGFSAGMDLKAFVAGERPVVEGRGFAGITRRAADKPLVAAVEGFALAGGLEVALSCDLIVAARDARFGIPEVSRGLVAAGGALLRLPSRISYYSAMELTLTGAIIDGERAHALGLITRLTDPGQAVVEALQLAETIAGNAPLAVAASKRILIEARDWPSAEAWERQEEIAGPVRESADAREGALAFTEKRDPVWTGR